MCLYRTAGGFEEVLLVLPSPGLSLCSDCLFIQVDSLSAELAATLSVQGCAPTRGLIEEGVRELGVQRERI